MRQHARKRGCTEGEVIEKKVRGWWRETDRETEEESGWVEVDREGEREKDKPCIISASLALEETWLRLNDIFASVNETAWKQRVRDQPSPILTPVIGYVNQIAISFKGRLKKSREGVEVAGNVLFTVQGRLCVWGPTTKP